jgi:molybdate transport system regulatory protein
VGLNLREALDDIQRLRHTQPMARASLEIKPRLIVKDERAIGPGKADLLEAIARTGSISAAAKQMGMSYSRAWTLVDTMNRYFKEPLVEAATGGAHGGGARVTKSGEDVLTCYRALQAELDKVAARRLAGLQKLLK